MGVYCWHISYSETCCLRGKGGVFKYCVTAVMIEQLLPHHHSIGI